MAKRRVKPGAPAVIIAPQHQSAPKPLEPERIAEMAQQPAPIEEPAAAPNFNTGQSQWFDSYDREMDGGPCTTSSDPQVNANMRRLYEQSLQEERLNPEEEVTRQYERTEGAMRPYRWQGQERWQGRENEEARLVRIMHPHTFIGRLRRAGIKAALDDPYELHRANGIGMWRWPKYEATLWLNSFVRQGQVGVTAWIQGEPKTVATLQYPYGPEWCIARFNEYNVVTNRRYRGWRSALLALIQHNVITEAQAHKALGEPRGIASLYYREQLFYHRSLTLGIRKQGTA